MSQEPNDFCTDTSFEVRIPEFVSGFLSEEERRDMIAHLESCRSCNLSVLIMRGVAQTGHEAAQVTEESSSITDLSAHLTEQQVVALYASPDSLMADERVSLERHLAGCPLCSQEIEFLKSLESDMTDAQRLSDPTTTSVISKKRTWFGMPRSAYAVAAIILLCAVVGSLLYVQRGDELSATVTHLRELQRNSGQLPIVFRESNKPRVMVVVPLPRASDQSRYVATLQNSARNKVDAIITVHTDTSKSQTYLIDTRNLPDGEFDLQVMDSRISDLPPVEFHFPFMLSTNP